MKQALWFPALLPLLFVAACAQPLQAVPIKPVENYAAKGSADGLAAGAEPFDTFRKSTSVFGTNVSREFTPVQLVVENAALDKLLVQRSNAKLICANGTALEPVGALKMFEQYREHIIGLPGAGFASADAVTADSNERTKSAWIEKEFPEQKILTGGARIGGFLYFQGTCPDRAGRRIELTADKMSSSDVISVSVELR